MLKFPINQIDTFNNQRVIEKTEFSDLPGNFLHTVVAFDQLHPTTCLGLTKAYLRIGNICLRTQNSFVHPYT